MDDKKILVIDDDPTAVKDVQAVLEQTRYSVYSVNTAEGVLEKLREVKPDLIILDLVLGQESGFKVAKEIKANSKYKDTPIIVVSLRKDDIDKRVAALSGAAEYLEKPVNPESLLFHVNDILSIKENP
jgi:two-component system alkaline phosphatase synthesis response regulator PhoP